jgi:potassium efflux system protein
VGLPVNTQQETTASAITVTPQWIEKQQQLITDAQAVLEKDIAALPSEEQVLQDKITGLAKLEITQQMLDEAAQKRQVANLKAEERHSERERVQTHLDQQRQHLSQLQTTLEELQKIPPSGRTAEQNQQLSELEKDIGGQKTAIELEKQYLEILNKQIDIAIKRIILAIEWHSQLQTLYNNQLIKEKDQLKSDAKTALEHHQETLLRLREELSNKIARLETVPVEMLTEMLEKASLDKETAEINIKNLVLERQGTESNLEREYNNLNEQQDKLENLRKTPPIDAKNVPLQNKRIAALENNINLQKKTIELEEKHLDILKQHIEQANQRLKLATEWHDKVQAMHQVHHRQNLETLIQEKQQRYLSRVAELRRQLEQMPEWGAQRYLLEAQIQEANELAQQVVRQLKIQHIQEQLSLWQKIAYESQTTDTYRHPLENIQTAIKELGVLLQDIQTLQKLLQNKIAVLGQQLDIVKKRGETLSGGSLENNTQAQQVLVVLKSILQQELEKMPVLLEEGKELLIRLENVYKENLHSTLLRVRKLPTSFEQWQSLLGEISTIPSLFMQQLQLTWRSLSQAFQQTVIQRWVLISIVTLIWLSLIIWMSAWFTRIFNKLAYLEDRSFIVHSLLLGLRLLRINAWSLAVTGVFLLLLWLTQPNQPTIIVILILLLAWLGSKMLINLSWLLLSDPNLKLKEGTKLFRQLRWIIIFTGILIAFTALVHVEHEDYVLKLSLMIRDMIDSLFMLLLSLTVLPIMRIRKIVLTHLQNRLQSYWLLVIRIITLLLPLAILAVSILGVIGYVSFGWIVAKHLSLFLLVLTGWLVARGFLTDFINLWKNFTLKHSHYNLLWTEDLIPLADKLLGIILIGLAVITLFWINGWYSDIAIRESIGKVFNFPLVTFADGNKLRVADVLLSVLIVWVVFWLGSWIRRVTYRWVYLKITDTGVRHSLSVFTQYMVILIGLLIALKAMGVDPTALAVFAGAVGVGIGFGLQNIANNFISGILLLIERPLRTGDLVNIQGSYEGKVTQIGIRSLTIQTWDNQEVIVPNSELISNAFTNWTHTDQILRTTLSIGISYDDDPLLAEKIIKGVLEEFPEILRNPDYQVYLSEFGDSSVNFRLDYFIDLHNAGRLRVKSNVLFRIWVRFKEAGIRIPYPQRDVHLKSVQPSSDLTNDLVMNNKIG